MSQRQTSILDRGWVGLIRMVERFVLGAIPAAPAGRPAGGPVVFRHYL